METDNTRPKPTSGGDLARVTIDIDSPVEDVWHALTSPDGLAGWMGAGSSVGREPGDDVVMTDVVTGRPRRGRVQAVDSGRRFAYTWWAEDEPDVQTSVAITLEPSDGGTRVTVVETAPRTLAASASAGRSQRPTATAAWSWRTALLLVAVQAMALRPSLVIAG